MMSLRRCEAEGKDYVVVKVDVEGVEYMLLERIMELGPRVFCIADHWPIEFHHTTKKKMAWHNRDNSTSRVVDRFGAMLKTCPRLTLSLGGTRTLKKCVLELQLAPRGSAGAH